MLNPDGSVNQAIDPIAWPDTVGIVKVWYPFFEIDKTIEKTITDQSKGYHDIDFLYAETDGKKHFDLN